MKHLPYVQALRDRHGHWRYYYRRHGYMRVTLPGEPGSPEFMAAYQAASVATPLGMVALPIGEKRALPGSVSRAIAGYYQHNSFTHELAAETQKSRRNILEGFRRHYGDMPLNKLKRGHVELLLGNKTPNMQRNWLKTLRGLMKFAVAVGLVDADPTADIKRAKVARTDGWHSWSDAEVAAFEAHHPIGSSARLAMALMLYTSVRRSDVVALGRQHVRDGRIVFKPHKTVRSTGLTLSIPILPPLAEALAATPATHLTFLTTEYGRPFSAAGFGGKFRDWCNEAGLPHCTAHGLRKAQLRRLAEAGCSEHEIQAISGHSSLEEIRTYTRAVQQSRLADQAFAKVEAAFPGGGVIGHNRGPALAE